MQIMILITIIRLEDFVPGIEVALTRIPHEAPLEFQGPTNIINHVKIIYQPI